MAKAVLPAGYDVPDSDQPLEIELDPNAGRDVVALTGPVRRTSPQAGRALGPREPGGRRHDVERRQ